MCVLLEGRPPGASVRFHESRPLSATARGASVSLVCSVVKVATLSPEKRDAQTKASTTDVYGRLSRKTRHDVRLIINSEAHLRSIYYWTRRIQHACLSIDTPVLWPKGHKNCNTKSVHRLLDTILVFLNHTDTALCDILYKRLENTLTLIFIVLNPLYFYRAMHFSAKRGIAIHVVCLSVTCVNCDHIGWNSSKIISPLVCLGRSLFATPT